jgi:hypothetical protein
MHGGGPKVVAGKPLAPEYTDENIELVRKGLPNMERHIHNDLKFELNVILAVNSFKDDKPAEVELVCKAAREAGAMYQWNSGSTAPACPFERRGEPFFVPCTPYGCIYMLEQAGVKIEGANAVVLGRSNIVGMPIALLLISRNATVTVCHSYTRDLPSLVRQADILIAAIGQTEMVRGDWIKPGAAVIDVGINSIPDASRKSGHSSLTRLKKWPALSHPSPAASAP